MPAVMMMMMFITAVNLRFNIQGPRESYIKRFSRIDSGKEDFHNTVPKSRDFVPVSEVE